MTDESGVRADADKPVPYDPETDPYDPNDEKAVEAFWNQVLREAVEQGRL